MSVGMQWSTSMGYVIFQCPDHITAEEAKDLEDVLALQMRMIHRMVNKRVNDADIEYLSWMESLAQAQEGDK